MKKDRSIKLTSPMYVIRKQVKKTKARFWNDVKVGDIVRFHTNLINTLGASNGLYALDIMVTNGRTLEDCTFSQNELLRYMSCFKLEEIMED